MRIILIFVISLSLANCSDTSKSSFNELKKCIDNRINVHLKEGSLDFYDLVSDVETKFIDNGILKDRKKVDYLEILESEIIEKKYFTDIKSYLEAKNFYYEDHVVYIFGHCPCKIEKNNILKEQCAIFSESHSKDSKDMIKAYINTMSPSDFEQIEYRAPAILMILIMNLEE